MRVQAIITELVFEHALRVRMKAETSDTASSSSISTAAATPDNASQVGTDGLQGDEDSSERSGSAAYSQAASSSTAGGPSTTNSTKGKGKASSKPEIAKGAASVNSNDTEKGGNKHLIGRINNLVSSDLANFENVGLCVVFVRTSSRSAK